MINLRFEMIDLNSEISWYLWVGLLVLFVGFIFKGAVVVGKFWFW